MRKSDILFLSLAVQMVLLFFLFAHAAHRKMADIPRIREKGEIVRRLGLTDLCLFTEARYTRHITQADLNTPFQDHPLSLEHFPSGSLLLPPAGLRDFRAPVPAERRKG
ncbi:MAG: hypothetical protein K8I29_11010 [Alphaproteobacteria bacterium]|uniref:Uncharacterized protein n=1 Tax=Candidatus Nitrobium versatile TaxID=2884831 RepID=A0A953M1X7_9BACT|nr:hypothetical protein [Candidatus Nitrobium versatile]